MKHPAYAAEKEVRLSIESANVEFHIRVSENGPIAYIELTGVGEDGQWGLVVKEPAPLPIRAIITPPGASDATVQGVCAALEAGRHDHDHQIPIDDVPTVDPLTGRTEWVPGHRVKVMRSKVPFI